MKLTKCSFALLPIITGLLLAAMLLCVGCGGGNAITSGELAVDKSAQVKPPPKDSAPPAAVTDLTVLDVTYCSADLTWTATGDDGTEGQASDYDLRYATFEITADNWDSADEVYGETDPLAAGEAEDFTVYGLDSSTSYYFALKVIDDAGNTSDLSNVAVGTTSAPQSGDWASDFVDYALPYLAMAYDPSGNPSVAYTHLFDNTHKFAIWNGTSWDIDLFQSGTWGGVDLAYNPTTGVPGVCFDAGLMVFAEMPDPEGNFGDWDFQELEENPSHRFSLAYDPASGFPAISHRTTEGRGRKATTTLRLLSWNGSAWVDDIVTTVIEPGYNSLAFDSVGIPHIASVDRDDAGCDTLRCSRKTAGEWSTDVVEYNTDGQIHVVSIAIDHENKPGIAYERLTGNRPRDLRYAHWNGSAWDVEVIEHGDSYFPSPSLAYNSSGVPMIGYIDRPANSTLHQVKVASATGSSWSIEVVAEGYIGAFLSLALDEMENPTICYTRSGSYAMFFAKKL